MNLRHVLRAKDQGRLEHDRDLPETIGLLACWVGQARIFVPCRPSRCIESPKQRTRAVGSETVPSSFDRSRSRSRSRPRPRALEHCFLASSGILSYIRDRCVTLVNLVPYSYRYTELLVRNKLNLSVSHIRRIVKNGIFVGEKIATADKAFFAVFI